MSTTGLEEISVAAEIFSPAKIYKKSRKLYINYWKNCTLSLSVENIIPFHLISPLVFNQKIIRK